VRAAVLVALVLAGCGGHTAAVRPPGIDGAGDIGDPDRRPDGSAGGAGGTAPDAALGSPTEIQPCRLLGLGHTISMDLSPDGVWAAYGSIEGGITLIGVADFVARRTITAHPGQVRAVAFSPDSTQIASADDRGNVALWTVADGTQVWSGLPLDGPVQALAFGPATELWALAVGGYLWKIDATTGMHVAMPVMGAVLAVSPAGDVLALGYADGSFAFLGAADVTRQVTVQAAHPGGVTAMRFSANGQRLVTGGMDGTTALWDLAGNLLARVAQPGHPVTSVDVYLGSTETVLSAGEKDTPGVYAFKPDGMMVGGYVVFPFAGRLSIDGKYLVSMTGIERADRGPVDVTQTAGIASWLDVFNAVAFSPDGRFVAESSDNNVRLWDSTTGEMVRMLDPTPPITTPAPAIAFSPDGTVVARNDFGGTVSVLGTSDSTLIARYPGATRLPSLAYSPDGQWLAAPGPSNVLLWHVSDGSLGPSGFVGHGGKQPTAVAFSPDGLTLAVGDAGGNATLWSFPDATQQATFVAAPQEIQQIGISPDGTRVVAMDPNGDVTMFTGSGVQVMSWPEGFPSFGFSSDRNELATLPRVDVPVEPDGLPEMIEVLLSSARTGAPLATYTMTIDLDGQGRNALGAVIAFAPHDHRLVVGGVLGRVLCLP
jgi:WD40 repeat protein